MTPKEIEELRAEVDDMEAIQDAVTQWAELLHKAVKNATRAKLLGSGS